LTDKFIIGLVGAPFGVKGFVKVRSLSGELEHLLALKSVTVSKDGKERLLQIEESAPAQSAVLMRFAGIDTPEAAKAFSGAQLIVDRGHAAPLGEGEFYIEDLKGIDVFSLKGEKLGQTLDIIEGGGGELVEIELLNGEIKLVPLRKEFFTEINPAKGAMVLDNLWILK
jgi:16S rRNA processing protein RimM